MLKTTSQLLGFHKSIEEMQAQQYSGLTMRFPEHAAIFERQAKESQRNVEMAQRAYREGVTDAFEVGFLADPLDPENYKLTRPEGSLAESVKAMISNEETIIRFCMDAATSSSRLLPDVPETFMRLVKRKKRGIEKLREV